MINRLPWHKKLRTSSANNLDKINEIIDYINHSDISEVALSETVSGRNVQAGKTASLKDLTVYGESIQDGTPTPDNPIDVQVVEGRNLIKLSASSNTSHNVAFNLDGNAIIASGTSNANNAETGVISLINPISFKAGQQYTLSIQGIYSVTDSTCTIIFYDASSAIFNSGNANGTWHFTPANDVVITRVRFRINTSGAVVNINGNIQLEAGSTATPYVPYGCIGLQIGNTATPIDLQGNVLASLPDGTKDKLKIDSAGHVTIEKCVGYIASYDSESVGDVYISTTGELSAGASVYYKLATPTTIDLGYIITPAIATDDEMQIIATITPLIDVGYWSYPEFTEMIADLKAYVDYKIEESEG